MSARQLTEREKDELMAAAEGVVGGKLRSITHFTEDSVEQVYLRDYLDSDANLESFASSERPDFGDQLAYEDTELGPYQFTIRVFEKGYLVRTIVDGHGVFATVDPIERDQFDELGVALRDTLQDILAE